MKIETEKLVLLGLDENLKALMSVPSYKIGSFTFDVEKRLLISKNESVKLTGKESYLLVLLAANANTFLEFIITVNTPYSITCFIFNKKLHYYFYVFYLSLNIL